MPVVKTGSSPGGEKTNALEKFILWLNRSYRTSHGFAPITGNFKAIASFKYINFKRITTENQELHFQLLKPDELLPKEIVQ